MNYLIQSSDEGLSGDLKDLIDTVKRIRAPKLLSIGAGSKHSLRTLRIAWLDCEPEVAGERIHLDVVPRKVFDVCVVGSEGAIREAARISRMLIVNHVEPRALLGLGLKIEKTTGKFSLYV